LAWQLHPVVARSSIQKLERRDQDDGNRKEITYQQLQDFYQQEQHESRAFPENADGSQIAPDRQQSGNRD
jgi:hypothetical protein